MRSGWNYPTVAQPAYKRLDNTPPSAKFVFYVLVKEGLPLKRKQLKSLTRLSERTLTNALARLLVENLVETRLDIDEREAYYWVFNQILAD